MNAVYCDNFRWDELLVQVRRKNVITVIGQGLYRIEGNGNGDGNYGISLYDYLAQEVAKECRTVLPSKANHKFAKAAFEYLKQNSQDYYELSEFLKKKLNKIHLISTDPLWKLARIKAFNIFITTAYDDFLSGTIKAVRGGETETLSYTVDQKNKGKLGNDLYKKLEYSTNTLVYHIFGNLRIANTPSYTESDILETIVHFHKDMERNPQIENHFGQLLQSSSLLFIGCGYDDWLSRFFIRTMANAPYEIHTRRKPRKYVGDDFKGNIKDPLQELPQFLKDHESEIFYTCGGVDFVDMLFERLGKDEIIQPEDFPGTVFISFEGKDRDAARQLATLLRKDGIDVWIDDRALKAGDIDKQIINAIDRCPVFIPIISRNSINYKTVSGEIKYHIKEWRTALNNMKRNNKKVIIVPVIIDNSKRFYKDFKNYYHFKVPMGNETGEYEQMRKQLKDIQQNFRGLSK
jgi:hypothetical protein